MSTSRESSTGNKCLNIEMIMLKDKIEKLPTTKRTAEHDDNRHLFYSHMVFF